MVKKIVVGTLLAVMSGGLIYGAINRTQAKDSHVSGESLIRQNANRSEQPLGQSGNRSGEAERIGRYQHGESEGPNNQTLALDNTVELVRAPKFADWFSVPGIVQQITEEAVFVQLDEGDVLTIEGMGLRFTQEQGFTMSEGQRVLVKGFFENDKFELGQITDLNSGLTVALREEGGRPLWAGGRGRQGL